MKTHVNQVWSAAGKPSGGSQDRGVALITTLVLLALLSAASLAMVLLVSSDTMINGYYGNYRGSFYAADSGINIVVASVTNAIQSSGNDAANPPLSETAVPSSVVAAYTAYQAAYRVVGDTGSWNGQFKLVANADGAAPVSAPTFTSAQNVNDPTNTNDLVWTFSYPFEITVQGQSTGNEGETITEKGTVTYSSLSGSSASGGPPSFSKWGGFIDNFASCQGPLVPGTMTGPFFTDGQWNFGNDTNPGYTFTDSVGQENANVSWWNGNSCTNSGSAPRGFTKPTFNNGLQLSQGAVTPPSDNYNQAQAVMDGKGLPPCTVAPCASDPPPSQAQMNQVLQTVNKTAYPSSGTPSSGVYFPVTTAGTSSTGAACSSSAPCFGSSTSGGTAYGGGFYVQGNAGVTLTATTGGDGTSNPTQTYTIVQAPGGTTTTTTIVVDAATGTTSVSSTTGSGRHATTTSETLSGIPTQVDPNTGTVMSETEPQTSGTGATVNPALVYVNGQITALSGSVQNDTGITVTATNDISITGNITYLSNPVSIPGDVLSSSTNAGVMGVYTNGNINLEPGSNGANLTVDASLAAIGSGTSGFETPGNSVGTWTILGGRSEDQAHGVSISQGNTYYDRRFATGSFGPPWFPTAVPQPGTGAIPSAQYPLQVKRISWSEGSRTQAVPQ